MKFRLPSAQTRAQDATERLDQALEIIIPAATDTEIREWFEERLEEMRQSYNDHLSRPET